MKRVVLALTLALSTTFALAAQPCSTCTNFSSQGRLSTWQTSAVAGGAAAFGRKGFAETGQLTESTSRTSFKDNGIFTKNTNMGQGFAESKNNAFAGGVFGSMTGAENRFFTKWNR